MGKKQSLFTSVISMATSMNRRVQNRSQNSSILIGFTQWRGVPFEWFSPHWLPEAS